MERTRYFRSANKFNAALNFLSGNVFPLTDDDSSLSFCSLIYVTLTWLIKVGYFSTGFLGSLFVENRTASFIFEAYGGIGVLCTELIILSIYLNLRRKDLRDLINQYNGILIDSDDLRRYVHDTVEPYKVCTKVYLVVAFFAAFSWSAAPILKILNTERFTYADYAVPACLSGQPFGVNFFIAGVILQSLGSWYMSFTKTCTDVYVSYFVMVLTAQYKYVRAQLAEALSQVNGEKDELSVINELQKCVRHHCAVIEIGGKLVKLLAFHIGVTYIICILKFCFIAFGIVMFENDLVRTISWVMYGGGCVVQAFVLCSCFQELLDASTAVTDDAFHEDWHGRGNAVKKIIYTIQLSNKMECRLSAYRIVDLIVPTMASIVSKSYSICLLLLEVN